MLVTGKRRPSADLIAGIFVHYREHLDWLLNTERKFEEVDREFHLPIIKEVDEWIKEEIQNDPKRADWFEVQLKDAFPTFKEWKQRKDEKEGNSSEFPNSKAE